MSRPKTKKQPTLPKQFLFGSNYSYSILLQPFEVWYGSGTTYQFLVSTAFLVVVGAALVLLYKLLVLS